MCYSVCPICGSFHDDGAYHVVDGRRYFICLNCADHMRREDIARGIRQAVRAENVRLGRVAR